MFVVEFFIGLMALLLLLSVGLLILKVVFSLVLLPIKLAWFLTKSLLALVIGLPLLLVLAALMFTGLPLLLVVAALPLCLVGGIVYAVVH
jgi:hypothetical protein